MQKGWDMKDIYGGPDPFANTFWPADSSSSRLDEVESLKWDSSNVRLPCSKESQYPVRKSDGKTDVVNRWELIETSLLRPINDSHELQIAILTYNSKYAKVWNFAGLHHFFDELDEEDGDQFFGTILPKIIELALRMPMLIKKSIPLLKTGQNRSISLTQEQIACLLANAFLCTFPRRNTQKRDSEYKFFPDINFNRLFRPTERSSMEKLKCIFNYFRRVTTNMPTGVVTFCRRSIEARNVPRFDKCDQRFTGVKLRITSLGTIEAEGKGLLQVDFANKRLGGGVLGQGCVQEEIRFMICPELIITRLFTEMLKANEALIVIGAEQFSSYSGYASSFEWSGNFVDQTPRDSYGRRKCQIVAIDALPFRVPQHQYRPELMLRELTKAYVGYSRLENQFPYPSIASGNWGCGAFNGNPILKSILQLMVCAVTERNLVYFTFGDVKLVEEIYEIYKFLSENRITVSQLWSYLLSFGQQKSPHGDHLFKFIAQKFYQENTGPQQSSSRVIPPLPKLETIINKNYSDTDEESFEIETEKKKKLNTPESDNERKKQPKISLADCLDSYFSKESSNRKPVTISPTEKIDDISIEGQSEMSKNDDIQIDDEGNEYIEASPPLVKITDDPGTISRQTKLLDFFKIRNNKK